MLSYQLPFSQSRISRGKKSIRFRSRNQSGFQNVTCNFIGSPADTKERRSYELCEQKVQGHAVSGAVFGEEASAVPLQCGKRDELHQRGRPGDQYAGECHLPEDEK